MSETKFTRGDWSLSVDEFFDGCILISTQRAGMVEICEIESAYLDANKDNQFEVEQLANANLIAAAPEMYEALELINETIDQVGLVRFKSAINIEKLLAKARGEHE